jgi:FkbM family methyltransferase
MKVLIISAFPPEPAPEANHALHISECLAKSGFTVHVLCRTGSIAPTQENIFVHPVIHDWSWSDLHRIRKYVRACRPDVVLLLYLGWTYNHQPMITFLPTICQTVLPGVPCIVQFENIDVELPPRSFVSRTLRKAIELWAGGKEVHPLFGTLLRDSSRIILLSSPHRDRLARQYRLVLEKSDIIPPPPLIRRCSDHPADARKDIRQAIGCSPDDFVLMYWGYIYPSKGVEILLEAFQIVCRHNSSLRLLVVGGELDFPTTTERMSCSDYFQMVRQLPEKLGIAERVTWTGNFNWDSDTGSRYLYAADACVLPLDYGVTLNNSSLAAASTHGVPVIGTELLEGWDEALEHGRNIYLCPPRNPEMLAHAIRLVTENTEIRERLRVGIQHLAQEWHQWEITTTKLVRVLESVVSSRKAGEHRSSPEHDRPKGTQDWERKSTEVLLHECDGVEAGGLRLSPEVWPDGDFTEDRGGPLVSVIVAAYNVENYISQCLDSLVHQTLRDIEIIVVNDASQDRSAGIIRGYAAKYPQIRVIHCARNKGLASVRNIGMRAAKGRYIAFLDGDDWADIRMCEVMYRRASADDADVLIGDATVFYDDAKNFGPLFDRHIRERLDPHLRKKPFPLSREPHVLLLELVAWTKVYKRLFLHKHKLYFEAGMNSYEDICFHFSVLLKAPRISLIDDPLFFYRRNRPGQITARTDRNNFEVLAVFEKIQQNLAEWNAPAAVWAMLIRTQFRICDWLLQDRVQSRDKREFFRGVEKQFRSIPEEAYFMFGREANLREMAKLLCMGQNWFRTYERIAHQGWPLFPPLYVRLYRFYYLLYPGRPLVRRGWGRVRRRSVDFLWRRIKRVLPGGAWEGRFQAMEEALRDLARRKPSPSSSEEPLVEICRIQDENLLFGDWSYRTGLGDAVWRMANDYYLTQTAVFREGDTVVDVGAHVGVVSMYLAKRYPFLQVYAVEPEPRNYECLIRNLELNGLTNVTAINKAVSGDGGKKRLYADPWDSTWATIKAETAFARRFLRMSEVESMTLDDLFEEYGIEHCRLLKMTAPGATQECLEGFKRVGRVDLLCGEADFPGWSRAKMEWSSRRIARQYFWRIIDRQNNGIVYAWVHKMPRDIEDFSSDLLAPMTCNSASLIAPFNPGSNRSVKCAGS